MKRREFIEKSAILGITGMIAPSVIGIGNNNVSPVNRTDDISLAQWALVKEMRKGKWKTLFHKNKWSQVIVAALLGATPGCLGAYAVVSLYTHNIFRLGALVAAMIATFGDEAFILFSLNPPVAIKLMVITFAIAVFVGILINLLFKKKLKLVNQEFHFEIHEDNQHCCETKWQAIINQFKKISFQRAILLLGLGLVLFGLISGELGHQHEGEKWMFPEIQQSQNHEIQHEHDHNNFHDHDHDHGRAQYTEETNVHESHSNTIDWIRWTFILVTAISFVLITIVNEHFLQEHLWGHIIKKHFLKIFLWTLGTLAVITFLLNFVEVEGWIKANLLIILLVALLIGIIPVSGPHLVFVSLYLAGTVPFSILLASSVVQDGHGALPLFAESKKSFLLVKGINLFVGLLVGLAGYFFNW